MNEFINKNESIPTKYPNNSSAISPLLITKDAFASRRKVTSYKNPDMSLYNISEVIMAIKPPIIRLNITPPFCKIAIELFKASSLAFFQNVFDFF
jgi:hypothetical protein